MNLVDRWFNKTYTPREIIIHKVFIENNPMSFRSDVMVMFNSPNGERGYAKVAIDGYALSHMNVDVIREAVYTLKREIEGYTFKKYRRKDYLNENQLADMVASELYRFNTIGNIRMRS